MSNIEPIVSLDFTKQAKLYSADYLKAFKKVLNSGWYILGEEVQNFEKEFANYLGSKYCIGVANGLEALQISLMALKIDAGDEVITTPISAVATTLAILAVGAKPVFVDTDKQGLINTDLIEKAVTKKTKAILPVHLYGQACNLEKLLKLCKKYKLFLIEDACQAHGSIYRGRKFGTFGEFGCFSFYPTKNLGAFGDGGAIITDNSKLAQIAREIRDYGQKSKYIHSRFGLNSRLDELQAALLRINLKHLDQENKKRIRLAKRYVKNLSGKVQMILPDDLETSNYHQFAIRVKNRNQVQENFKKAGVQTLVHYPLTIPDQPFLKKEFGNVDIPEARKFVKETLSLPIHPYLTLQQIDYICSKL